MKITIKDKLGNASTPDTLATVEHLVERANMFIDDLEDPITIRDGMFEIWVGEPGSHSDCIARERTVQECINAACEYMRKLVDELAALAVEDVADEAYPQHHHEPDTHGAERRA